MSPTAIPEAELSNLPKSDGSATFSYCGYSVTGSVNGPLEAQRRDENPFEAILDINVRPAAGVGGTAERQLESILQPALRQLIPIRSFPRTVIQITLQISETPENVYVNSKLVQARLNLALIPALLHTAVLSLLTAAIPLKEIATAVSLAIPSEENARIISDPDTREAEQASSLHVMAFTSSKELLLVESEGSFTESQWDAVLKAGEQLCCREDSKDLDQTMHDGELESASIKSFIRSVMETKTAGDLHWK